MTNFADLDVEARVRSVEQEPAEDFADQDQGKGGIAQLPMTFSRPTLTALR